MVCGASAALDIKTRYHIIKLNCHTYSSHRLYAIPDIRSFTKLIEEQYKKNATEILMCVGYEDLKKIIQGMYFPFDGGANVSIRNFVETKHKQLFLGLIFNLQKAPAAEFYDHRGILGPHPQALELLNSATGVKRSGMVFFTAYGRELSLIELRAFTRHQNRR